MTETISSEWRTARKVHKCDYCGDVIHAGERYHHAVMKYDGMVYTWDEHEKCDFIASEIWDYVDPDEGMTEEDFNEGCADLCRCFICPDCEKYDKDDICDEYYCLDKVYDLLKEYELYRAWRDQCYDGWKLRKRNGDTGDQRGDPEQRSDN